MSTIRANSVADLAGTGPADLYMQSAARLLTTLDHNTATILFSLNTSSITDNGTGLVDTNITSNFLTANYVITVAGERDAASDDANLAISTGNTARGPTTSLLPLTTALSQTAGLRDLDRLSVSAIGDLA